MIRTIRDVEGAAMWLRGQLDLLGQAELVPPLVCSRMISDVEDIVDYCRWARAAGMTPIRPAGDAGAVPDDARPIAYRLRRRGSAEVQT